MHTGTGQLSKASPHGDALVRVWFGDHVIAGYVAEWQTARQYQELTQRRFLGLRVTLDTIVANNGGRDSDRGGDGGRSTAMLPPRRWWEMPPR